MTACSRTPERDPHRCAVCVGMLVAKAPQRLGDSLCLPCGKLLSLLRGGWGGRLGVEATYLRQDTRLSDMGMDSLDMVSLVMEVEEFFDLDITDESARNLTTVADLIRWIREIERNDQK